MFFDRKETPLPVECESCGSEEMSFGGMGKWDDNSLTWLKGTSVCGSCGHDVKVDQQEFDVDGGEWKRIERKIYSPFWRAAHNLIAHPLLAIYRPWGDKLHEYTADKMYEPNDKYTEVVTDND
jgi:hypothetical protein